MAGLNLPLLGLELAKRDLAWILLLHLKGLELVVVENDGVLLLVLHARLAERLLQLRLDVSQVLNLLKFD